MPETTRLERAERLLEEADREITSVAHVWVTDPGVAADSLRVARRIRAFLAERDEPKGRPCPECGDGTLKPLPEVTAYENAEECDTCAWWTFTKALCSYTGALGKCQRPAGHPEDLAHAKRRGSWWCEVDPPHPKPGTLADVFGRKGEG